MPRPLAKSEGSKPLIHAVHLHVATLLIASQMDALQKLCSRGTLERGAPFKRSYMRAEPRAILDVSLVRLLSRVQAEMCLEACSRVAVELMSGFIIATHIYI